MPSRFKLNAVAAGLLAAAFYWFFMFAKHDPHLSPIVSFGDDPYDAAGSFCMIASLLLAILSLVRAFRPCRPRPSRRHVMLLARTQMAIPAGILVTLGINVDATARHTAQWFGKPAGAELLELMAGMAALAVLVLLMVRAARPSGASASQHSQWRAAGVWTLVSALTFAVFPESLIPFVLPHFLAIVLAFVLVAGPQAAFAIALAPCDSLSPLPSSRPWLPWTVISAIGIAIGASVFAVEMREGAGTEGPLQILTVSAVYLGAGTALMIVGYAFLGKPLGLFLKLPPALPANAEPAVQGD